MRVVDIKAALQHVPLFSDLDEADLGVLAELCKVRAFPKANVIFYEDDPGTSCYVVLSGKVKIVVNADDGREHILGMLGPNDFFGEMSLIDGEPRSASAIAVEDSRLLMVSRDEFVKLLRQNPDLTLKLLVALSQRLRAADRNMESLAFLSAPGRVSRLILELGDRQGRNEGADIVVDHTMTRQELASLAGTSRETLTRVIMDYQERGFIELDKNRLVIKNAAKLRELMV